MKPERLRGRSYSIIHGITDVKSENDAFHGQAGYATVVLFVVLGKMYRDPDEHADESQPVSPHRSLQISGTSSTE